MTDHPITPPSRAQVDDALLHLRRNAEHSVPSEEDVAIVAAEITRLRRHSEAFARFIGDLLPEVRVEAVRQTVDATDAEVLIDAIIAHILSDPLELDRIAEMVLGAPAEEGGADGPGPSVKGDPGPVRES